MPGSINQIAELAGTSRGTVDRVLNRRGRVNQELAAKIEHIAEEIGYVPKHVKTVSGSAMSPNYQLKIGVITQLCHSSFMIEIHRGIEEESRKLSRQGISVLLRESATVDEAEQLKAIDELLEEGVDGLVIMPVDGEGVISRLNELNKKNIPVITFNTDISGTGRLCFVGLDNIKSGRTAAGLMNVLLQGKGQILGITGNFANSVSRNRIIGFDDELKKSFPGMELVGIQSSADLTEKVQSIVESALRAYPELAGILVISGGQEGVKKAFDIVRPKKKPMVIFYDQTPKNVRLLREGVAEFIIDQEGYYQGYRSVSLMADKLRWNKDPDGEFIYTKINILTKYSV